MGFRAPVEGPQLHGGGVHDVLAKREQAKTLSAEAEHVVQAAAHGEGLGS